METSDRKSIKVQSFTVPAGRRTLKVLRPLEPAGRVAATHYGEGLPTLWADEEGCRLLRQLFLLASVRKEECIFLPVRHNAPTDRRFESVDLVLCHHSLQLRRSGWKAMRQYLAGGTLQSVKVPRHDPEKMPKRAGWRPFQHDFADLAVHSRTLFIVGSAPIFQVLAYEANVLAERCSDGDHTHLFRLARHERNGGAAEDLTFIRWEQFEEVG